MFKLLSLILSMFVMTPIATSAVEVNFNHAPETIQRNGDEEEDPNVLHGYTYTEEEDGYHHRRIFDSLDIGPQLKRSFCAPSGYIFTIDITKEELTEIVDQAEFAHAAFDYVS